MAGTITLTPAQFTELSKLRRDFNGNMLLASHDAFPNFGLEVTFATHDGYLHALRIEADGKITPLTQHSLENTVQRG